MLNQPKQKRLSNLDESLAAFEYINGNLFAQRLNPAQFDSKMREALLDLCALDWSIISPAIFGSLFQSIMDANARRNLGAHYTSEENILKLIKPLFLDALWTEFEKVKSNKTRLLDFHKKLRTLTFLDPACGCGNFLVITYRELRLLELAVLRASYSSSQQVLNVQSLINVDVDQFYGIEIEEFPAQIAQVALWLTDHQMNMKVSQEFGSYFARIPLKASPRIVCGNALTLDWAQMLAPHDCSYILGNPPFIGHQWRSNHQMADMNFVWGTDGKFGRLDFVTCWHKKATDYMQQNKQIKTALVSTNSICQGEQVGTLWSWMLAQGVKIQFAHRTFSWNNEARGKAAVHCVIVGFGLQDVADKTIYEYEDIKGEPHAIKANNINPYLIDAPDIVLPSRITTPSGLPQLIKGSQPTDGGHLILSEFEKAELIAIEPQAEKWIRPYIGGEELINGSIRYCLWFKDANPNELKLMPNVMQKIKAVAEWRLTSATASVREYSSKPSLFTPDRQPKSNYLALPQVSSERRKFIPIAFLSPTTIASNQLRIIENASHKHFGILNSTFHNAWVRMTCGRLESRFRYEPAVYNNFPWPEVNALQTAKIEIAAQAILDARALHTNSSLADLYDPLTMPANLLKAHNALDKAVDTAYGYKGALSDAARVAFLFERYQQITSLLPSLTNTKTKVKRASKTSI